jgi:hypothetical protein
MSDATGVSLSGLADDVAAYVRDVRVELADLPVEDVDDLTGGMEADLSELASESGGDLVGRLGSPGLYAAELRAAAGLPERVAGSGRQRHRLSDSVAHARTSFTMLTGKHPWLRPVTAFLVTLRPAWWVLRGYLAAWSLWSFLAGMRGLRPHGVLELGMALVAIVVSVQLGRGWLRHVAMTRPLLALANAAAVVVALIASSSGLTSGEANYGAENYSPPPGVSLEGQQVRNIYVYGSDGQRVNGVRLFDQDGRPLGTAEGGYDPSGNPIGVVRDGSGAPVTNVYPRALFGRDPWQVIDPADPQMNQGAWTPPMSIVPLASSPPPTSTGTVTGPTPTSTTTVPAPTATTKPAQARSARRTPQSGPSPSVTRSVR